ncbi:unnamed protein product [Cyprideis torosa]|uniref:DUF4708 domain-containing protein n=1 Tax=Cyprideis torosa TaxID=163714 RepID=A0A7R8WHY2_9CRUS|nr:unnamed protein product [Cyprideis torosa]CAG0893845.1 unnamed protein product [Cyprideis torosa]
MSSRNAKKASIFFARLPQFDDLRLVTLRILTGTSQSISDFAEQIWRTREVIFLTKGRILASPQAFNKHVFTAVARAEDLDSEELKQVFQSLNLEIIKRNALSKSGFQECLKYTLEALLAPDWNKVQNYFIQGRDFLINSGSMNAVKLHVVITETHLQLTVTPMGLSWRPNSMDDLGVPWTAQQKFLNPKGKKPPVIGKAMIKCPMVHVLPSFRTGHVLSIHREIPPGAPFDSLDALRKYWKNTYGYRLSDIPPTYVNVSFRTGGGVGTAMAYPAICIRTKPPVFQPR